MAGVYLLQRRHRHPLPHARCPWQTNVSARPKSLDPPRTLLLSYPGARRWELGLRGLDPRRDSLIKLKMGSGQLALRKIRSVIVPTPLGVREFSDSDSASYRYRLELDGRPGIQTACRPRRCCAL